jgi:hypothetical protein
VPIDIGSIMAGYDEEILPNINRRFGTMNNRESRVMYSKTIGGRAVEITEYLEFISDDGLIIPELAFGEKKFLTKKLVEL